MLNEIIGLKQWEREMLLMAATMEARRFCAPVYLVGSCLYREDPMDVDIILTVSSLQYDRLIGVYKKEYNDAIKAFSMANGPFAPCIEREARFCAKQKEYFEGHLIARDVDFKIQPYGEFLSHNKPKLRLDPFKKLFPNPEEASDIPTGW